MNSAISLTLPDIFPDEALQDISYYLKGINQQKLIEVAVFLIYIADTSSGLNDNWAELFTFWFDSAELEIANDIYLRIKQLEREGLPGRPDIKYKYIFLNPLTSLRLLDYIIRQKDLPNHENDVEPIGVNLMLFKLILRLNTDFNAQIEVKHTSKDTYTSDFLIHYYIPFSMAQYEVYNSSNLRLLYTYTMQQIKSLYLFEFLEVAQPNLLKKFLDKYSCESIQEYFNFYITIIVAIFNRVHNRDQKKYREPNSFSYEASNYKAIHFTDQFLINQNYSDEEELDFKDLRASPLIKFRDGQYAIVNELFTIQKIYNGLYFELKDIYENELNNKKNTFRTYFTAYFSESFLLYKVLRMIYKKRSYIQFTGDEIKEHYQKEGGPDYYIRNGKKIFLFENKDNFISPIAKTSYDFTKIIEDVNKKLVTEGKGIAQLIKNIKSTLGKKYTFDKAYHSNNCKIYPILVTHRNEFDASGINRYLNEHFAAELAKLKSEGYTVANIQPLTLINIDVLLANQHLLKAGTLRLDELIDQYHQFVNTTRIHVGLDQNRDTKIHETYYSFSDYMFYVYARKNKIDYKLELLKWAKSYFKPAIFNK